VADLMPQLTEDLKELIAIPSVSAAGLADAYAAAVSAYGHWPAYNVPTRVIVADYLPRSMLGIVCATR
jgi:acetylornithine deacetylase/succinyl-diaminopimelate desuccinylase-like protein